MNKILLLVLFGVTAAHAAVDEKAIAKCAAQSGDLARLSCYDEVAKKAGLFISTKTVHAGGKGMWEVSTTTNPVDDSKTVTATLDSTSGTNRRRQPITVVLRCQSNKTEMFVVWNDYLGRDNSDVLIRLGDEKAVTESWRNSTDNTATFNPNTISTIKKMLTAPKMVLQVTPYNENQVTAVFDLTGTDAAVKPIREQCGW